MYGEERPVETPFSVASLVEHPAFGVGRVIAVQGETVHIYFHDKGGSYATKMKVADAKKLLRVPAIQHHEWLSHLPPFTYDPKLGKYRLQHERLTHEQAVAKFLATFPGGFSDAHYLGTLKSGERVYKEHFARMCQHLLVQDGSALLESRAVGEFRNRLLDVARINLLHHTWDQGPIKDALADLDVEAVPSFFAAVTAAARADPSERTFDALAEALYRLPAPGSRVASWPVATIFPYLARPDAHMFLKPAPTQEAARRLGFELNYKADPNWLTYKSLVAFAKALLGELARYGAKDFIDVQSFIFVTWIDDYADAEAARPEP